MAPELPTVRETVAKFVHAPNGWQAMFVPAGTPPDIVTKLNKEMNLVLQDPELASRLKGQFTSFIGGPPEAVTKKIKDEGEVVAAILKRIGFKPR